MLYVLDLDTGTYVSSNTKDFSMYDGEFQHSPDNLVRTEEGKFLYFTEDGGESFWRNASMIPYSTVLLTLTVFFVS